LKKLNNQPEHIREILKRVMKELKEKKRGNYKQDNQHCWR